MAEAFDESSNTVEELEISQIEELASVPNFDNVTTCFCRRNCIREIGRNFSQCKSLNQYCSSVCHGGNSLCLNNCRSQERDSDDSSSSVSFFIYIYTIIDVFHCDFVYNCILCLMCVNLRSEKIAYFFLYLDVFPK